MTKKALGILVAIVALLPAGSSWGGGFAAARFGGEAGHPTTDNLTAIYFNPAGLALDGGTRLYVEGLFASHTASYVRPVDAIDNLVSDGAALNGTPAEAVDANAGTGNLNGMLAAPFAAVATDFGVPNLAVGLGFYVPLGGEASWDQNSAFDGDQAYPGAVDGVQRWAVIDASLRSYYFTAAGAYRLPDLGLSFGLGFNLVRNDISFLQARTTSATDDLVSATGNPLEGRALIEANNLTYSFSAGVIYQPDPVTWVGLSYQSEPGFGETAMTGTLTSKFGNNSTTVNDIDFLQALPDVIRLGVRRRFGPAEARLAADYTRWSNLTRQCLVAAGPDSNCSITDSGALADDGAGVIINTRRDFQDTYGVRVGGSYFPNRRLELAGSVTYDSNAIPDDTLDAAIIDMDKLVFQAEGRQLLLDDHFEVSLAVGHVLYFERTVESQPTLDAPTRKPNGAGTYNQAITFGLVGLGYQF